ncbi:MAG: HAMP domain-containing protein [Gemmatimonadales bacterium]|nr:HAMP domain-containing protein [Gemmatimonadales bacterium]
MTSIRRQLTVWYVLALAITLMAFGTILYLDRRQSANREIDERLDLEARFSTRWLGESYRVLESLTARGQGPDGAPTLETGVGAYFEGIRDFLLITDPEGRVLFVSEEARALSYTVLQTLQALMVVNDTTSRQGTITLPPPTGSVRYLVRPVRSAGPEIDAILVAARSESILFGPRALLRSMLFTAPLILLISVSMGSWLAGKRFRPLTRMMDEVEAISDGRSLHRRLAVTGSDEMARLAITVNRMIARLENSFAALHRFTADASHELKTPLMVLRAGVERALTHPETPAEALQSLDETLEGVNWMTELVENLLILARADEGRAPLAVEACDLREIVAEAVETGGMLAEGAGNTVGTEVPDHPVILAVDRTRIRQLLLNLVTNAVKYTPAGGRVLVGLVEEPEHVVLEVRDTGVGIAPGDLPHVFDRFWRADPARTRTGEKAGTGLGLAITKWVAEAHGGSIEVQSRPGRGTIFTVLLPRKPGGPARRTPIGEAESDG